MQPEAKFKKHLKERFEEVFASNQYFWLPIIAGAFQKAGVPDIFASVYCIGHRSAWIEAKRDDEPLRKSQQLTIPEMARAGSRVVVAHTHMKVSEDSRQVDLTHVNLEGRFIVSKTTYRWHDLGLRFWADVLGIEYA